MVESLEFHRTRYDAQFEFDELRWSRIRPCLAMVQMEQRENGRRLSVLDVGCGDGTVSKLFLDAGHVVFGVDIVPEFVEKAIEKGIRAKTADVTQRGLPFAAGEMDAVYAGALVEHVYDPEFFLRECYRVLKERGILVLSVPNIASLTSRLRMMLGRGPKFYAAALSWEFGGHIRVFTAGSLRRVLEQNGFEVEELIANVVSFVPAPKTRRPWSALLARWCPSFGEVLMAKARKRAQGPP